MCLDLQFSLFIQHLNIKTQSRASINHCNYH